MPDSEKNQKLIDIVRKRLLDSPRCHDWDHTDRVTRNARRLAALEGLTDLTVIVPAALLHDVARADEMAIQGKLCHAIRGAEIAAEILRDENYPPALIEKIVRCVRRHRYRGDEKPETLEEKIVYDADKLDSLGAVGLGRAFHFAGRVGARVHNTAEEALNSASYSVEDTAWREYLVKLRYVPEKLMTASGKQLALDELAFMAAFFDRLNKQTFDAPLA